MKQALCVKAEQVRTEKDNSKWELFLLPREGEDNCETNEEYLQIIPYITIINNSDHVTQLLSYKRGSSSGEKRLVDQRSIGFGGHMDTLPLQGDSLDTHISKEAIRELNEELGITNLTVEKLLEVIEQRAGWIIPTENSSPTDKVHLGVTLFLYASELEFGESELGHIDDLKFVSLNSLKTQSVMQNVLKDTSNLKEVYENWSLFVIERLV